MSANTGAMGPWSADDARTKLRARAYRGRCPMGHEFAGELVGPDLPETWELECPVPFCGMIEMVETETIEKPGMAERKQGYQPPIVPHFIDHGPDEPGDTRVDLEGDWYFTIRRQGGALAFRCPAYVHITKACEEIVRMLDDAYGEGHGEQIPSEFDLDQQIQIGRLLGETYTLGVLAAHSLLPEETMRRLAETRASLEQLLETLSTPVEQELDASFEDGAGVNGGPFGRFQESEGSGHDFGPWEGARAPDPRPKSGESSKADRDG